MRIQQIIDALNAHGEFLPVRIELVGHESESALMVPDGLFSYRGYYEQLAIDYAFSDGMLSTVARLRDAFIDAIDSTFEGYKGGDFMMREDTPVWVSRFGESSGWAPMEIILGNSDHGSIVVLRCFEIERW